MNKLLLTCAVAVLASLGLNAADFSRKGKFETFVLAQYNGGDSTTADNATTQAEIDSFISGGLGMGYHFHDHFSLALDLSFGAATINGADSGSTVQTDSLASLAHVSLEYNILKSRFTPLLSAGLGFISYTGDFGSTGTSFQETDLAYGAGGGVRWNITDRWAMKAIYRATFTNLEGADETLLFHTMTLSVGISF